MLFAAAIVFLTVVYNTGIFKNAFGNENEGAYVRLFSEDKLEQMPPYILKECGGYIGIFVLGEDVPFAYIDTPVSTLPKLDKAMLKAGIKIETQKELVEAVEDFS
jgi:hypothetical protein